MKERRRWTDVPDDTRFDRGRRIAIAVWPFLASFAAVGLLLAATVVSVRAIRDRDRLEEVTTNSANAAIDAKRAAAAAASAADRNRQLLEASQPCTPETPPDSPACQQAQRRAEVVNDAIARIASELAKGLAAHDANTSAQHEALRRRTALPHRSPITAAPRPSTAPTAPPTTACERLPNGRCRP